MNSSQHLEEGTARQKTGGTRAKTRRRIGLLPEPRKANDHQSNLWRSICAHAFAPVERKEALGREDHAECTVIQTIAPVRDTPRNWGSLPYTRCCNNLHAKVQAKSKSTQLVFKIVNHTHPLAARGR